MQRIGRGVEAAELGDGDQRPQICKIEFHVADGATRRPLTSSVIPVTTAEHA
jgi:hypothetical protein